MSRHIGTCRAEYLTADKPFGFLRQATYPYTDDLTTLLAAPDFASPGLFFEPMTRSLICEPRVVWKDLTAANVDAASLVGPWREAPIRHLGKKGYSQYSSAPGLAWAFTTSTNIGTNAAFCLHLQFGPCPYSATHSPEECYRTIQWPYPYVSGVGFKLKLRYGAPPILEANTGNGFVELGSLYGGADLATFDNAQAVLTVLLLDGAFGFRLGPSGEFGPDGFLFPTDKTMQAGPLRVEGKNGACVVGWGDIRFKASGTYTSHWLRGPRSVPSPTTVRIDVHGRKAAGQVLRRLGGGAGVETSTIDGLPVFRYSVEMAGASPITGTDLATDTPVFKSAFIEFPPLYDPITTGTWTAINGIRSAKETHAFDLKTLIEDRFLTLEADNWNAAWRELPGAQAVRFYLGFDGIGEWLRGYYYANTEPDYSLNGDASFTFDGKTMLHLLGGQEVANDVHTGNWCVYAAARFLLEHGGIIPTLTSDPDGLAPYTIPPCPSGPIENYVNGVRTCPTDSSHMILPPGQSWVQFASVLGALSDLQRAASLRIGQAIDSYHMMVNPFDFNAAYTVKKVFRETASGANGADLNEFLRPLLRFRRTQNQRTEITVVGMAEDGKLLYAHHLDEDAIGNRLSPKHLPFPKAFRMAYAGLTTQADVNAQLNALIPRLTLPEEGVLMNCYGQPQLFARDVFVPVERTQMGNSSEYYIEQITHAWEAPTRRLTASILGNWTAQENGTNRYPGVWNPQSPYLYF